MSWSDDRDRERTTRAQQAQRDRRRRLRFLRAVVSQALFAVALFGVILLRVYVIRPVEVLQNSMSPTLAEGDRLLIDTWSIRSALPARGAVIVVTKPQSDMLVVKRVVAVAGDTLRLGPNGVWVNGQRLEEPYINPFANEPLSLTVPAGSVFVLGDNRPDSEDSRDFGCVPAASILGRAVVRFWPWEKRGKVAARSSYREK